jgi:hypothetical protein
MTSIQTFQILQQADCEMKFVCSKKWDELAETELDGVRFCGGCKKAVFYASTAAELRVAAERGLCVYIVPDSAASTLHNLDQICFPQLTRERLRRIEAKALRRLKGPTLGVPIVR